MRSASCLAAGLLLVAPPVAAQTCYAAIMPAVVQITGMQVGPQGDNGICTLEGQVVVSFSGPFAVGQTIRTTIPCTGPNYEGGFGSYMYDPEEVESKAIMEIHFDSAGFIGENSVGWPLIFFRDGPTAEPEPIPGMCLGVYDAERGITIYIDPITGQEVPAD